MPPTEMDSHSEGTVYRYDPLPHPHSIRLIKDLRYNPSQSELFCTLEICALDKCPPFKALSYTWASALYKDGTDTAEPEPSGISQICCNDSHLAITENLYEGLLELSKSETGYLWADAICINQADLSERASQVLIMGDIYSKAEETSVWLGKETPELADFEWLHTVFFPAINSIDKKGVQINWRDPKFYEQLQVENPESRLSSYAKFLQRHRWFDRAWIVQELALARKISVRCGSSVISWPTVFGFARCLRNVGLAYETHYLRANKLRQSVGNEIINLDMLHQIIEDGGPHAYSGRIGVLLRKIWGTETAFQRCVAFLEYSLLVIRGLDTTDPRDKVYAVLGISAKYLPSQSCSLIIPDYNLAVEKAYENVAAFLLQNIPVLTTLSFVEDRSQRRLQNLPSWVPDYSSPTLSTPLIMHGFRLFSAFPAQVVDLQHLRHVSDSVLTLRGAKVDTVKITCFEAETWTKMDHVRHYIDFCLNIERTYINGQHRTEALWRTLINNMQRGQVPSSSLGENFRSWVLIGLVWYVGEAMKEGRTADDCLEELRALAELRGNEDPVSLWLPSPIEVLHQAGLNQQAVQNPSVRDTIMAALNDLEAHSRPYSLCFVDRSLNSRLYATSRGYLGQGPRRTAPDDEIWVLEGAKVPYVLHRVPGTDRCVLVGETYLHGFMNGEVVAYGLLEGLEEVRLG